MAKKWEGEAKRGKKHVEERYLQESREMKIKKYKLVKVCNMFYLVVECTLTSFSPANVEPVLP